MKCPLMKKYFQSETDKWHTEIMDCGKEKCAWWIVVDKGKQYREGCALAIIAEELAGIREK